MARRSSVTSRKLDACEEVVRAIQDKGGEAFAHACNIGRKEDLQALVNATIQKWGGVDMLVCNAAVNPYYGPAIDMSDEAYDKVMNSNVRSNFWLCNMVLPQMAERGGGSIIIVSSVGGLLGSSVIGVYGISKAADMAPRAQHLRGVGPEEHSRELHRTGPRAHRLRESALGEPGDLREDDEGVSAAPHRRAG